MEQQAHVGGVWLNTVEYLWLGPLFPAYAQRWLSVHQRNFVLSKQQTTRT